MEMSARELWTILHGMVLGAAFLLAFTGGFVAIWDFRSAGVASDVMQSRANRLAIWTWSMSALVWLTVVLGTYVIYPWYRAKAPAGTTGFALATYPKNLLLSDPRIAGWHEFGMEWKEHIAWLAPILATAVAFVATRYWKLLLVDKDLRPAMLVLFTISFFCAGVAGALGALINKIAPTK